MPAPIHPSVFPARQGLYDPVHERDACGTGFVASAAGLASREIVQMGQRLLVNLSHRGAAGCDPHTGDGAGILLQIPRRLLAAESRAWRLPGAGDCGVAMLFLPRDPAEPGAATRLVEEAVRDEARRCLAGGTCPWTRRGSARWRGERRPGSASS